MLRRRFFTGSSTHSPQLKLTSRCLQTPGGSVIGCSQIQYKFFPLPFWRAAVSETGHVSLGGIFVVVEILGRLSCWELRQALKATLVAGKSMWDILYPKEISRHEQMPISCIHDISTPQVAAPPPVYPIPVARHNFRAHLHSFPSCILPDSSKRGTYPNQ
jgi:hypothetical protein